MADRSAPNPVATSSNLFSNDFFKVLATEQHGNLITSPLSVEIGLSMAAYGARGNTATQMRNVLHLPKEDSVGRSGFHSLIVTSNNVKNAELRLANKLFVNAGFQLISEYKALTQVSFLSATEEVNFGDNVAAARTINSWCEERTNNRIRNVINPDALDSMTRLVLINAVYFKGEWDIKFDPTLTEDRPFHVNENTVKQVPTMFRNAEFLHGHLPELDATFIEIPYKGKELSMIIVLPNEMNGLKKIENNLQKLSLTRIAQQGHTSKCMLFLPKFKIESTIQLNDILQKMGMTDMFDPKEANFSGIAENKLHVSNAIQKAFIEVNEEGTEAAAVTGFVLCQRSMPSVFDVNRPAYYAIKSPEAVLFAGYILDPSEECG